MKSHLDIRIAVNVRPVLVLQESAAPGRMGVIVRVPGQYRGGEPILVTVTVVPQWLFMKFG